MEAIILAGGLGTRLRSVVSDVPKPMAPINGRPFLEYQMEYWLRQGVTRFILSVGYKSELIQQHFGDKFRTAEVCYCVESEPLGTGGALLSASEEAEGPTVLVLNGDTYAEFSLPSIQIRHKALDATITVMLLSHASTGRYGAVQLSADGCVADFAAKPALPSHGLINAGVYLFNSAFLSAERQRPKPCSLEADLFPAWIKKQTRIIGFPAVGKFIDIGVPEDWQRAASVI